MGESVISVDNISVRYRLASERPRTVQELIIGLARGRRYKARDFWALKDVSFELARGDSIGIIGANGSGKSTLLKVIAGILRPTGGRIEVRGRVAPMIELGAGFSHELTGLENIYLNASILGFGKKAVDRKLDGIIEFSGLGDFIYLPIRTYSSGMIARLAFSIATEIEPVILMVDEILAVGDKEFREKCQKRMDGFIEKGVTLILVSHSMGEVQRLCKRAIWLEGGTIRMAGSADEVVKAYER